MQTPNYNNLDYNPQQPFMENAPQPMPYSIIQPTTSEEQMNQQQGQMMMGNMPSQVVEVNSQQQIIPMNLGGSGYIPVQPPMSYAQAVQFAKLSEEEVNDIKSNLEDGAELIVEKYYNVEGCKPLYDLCAHSPYFIVKSRKHGAVRNIFFAKLNIPCCFHDICKSSCIESDKFCDIKLKYLQADENIFPFINNYDLPNPCAECFLGRHTCNLNKLQSVTTGCDNEVLSNHQIELFSGPSGTVTVHEPKFFCGIPTITIRDNEQKTLYRIASNTCNFPCCLFKGSLNCLVSCENVFNIFDPYGLKTLGRIYKSGYPCSCCTFPLYYYFIKFPEDAQFEQKMQILFASMLFDRYYYDKHNYIR